MHRFFSGHDDHGNVVFNFSQNVASDLSAFAAGYHEAGKLLIKNLEYSRGYSDYNGYPILFLYRHALELYLKAIVFRGAELIKLGSNKNIDTENLFTKHRLTWILPKLESIFKTMGWEWSFELSGLKSFGDFVDLIRGIEAIDPESYHFRFPVNKNGKELLPHLQLLM